jgi:hypothetical protein
MEATAIEKLASELYWKLERVAPNEERVGGIDWDALTEDEKQMYRAAIEHVLLFKEELARVLKK